MFVGSGHHQYVVSCHSHVSREDVGGHAESGNVSNVAGTVGVRPSYCRQNTAHGLRIVPRRVYSELASPRSPTALVHQTTLPTTALVHQTTLPATALVHHVSGHR